MGHDFSVAKCCFPKNTELLRLRPFSTRNDPQKILRILRGNIDFSKKVVLFGDFLCTGYDFSVATCFFSEKHGIAPFSSVQY